MLFRPRFGVTVFDLLMVAFAWYASYWLRFNLGTIPDAYLHNAMVAMPVVVMVQAVFFRWFGVDRGVWRYSSLSDLARILKADPKNTERQVAFIALSRTGEVGAASILPGFQVAIRARNATLLQEAHALRA